MPQDQDDIKGADAMKQAPTPGPLRVVAVPVEPTREMLNEVEEAFPRSASWVFPKIWKVMIDAAPPFLAHDYGLAPTAPVEASGSEREADAIALRQARYVLKDLHAKDGSCGYGKLASVCERIADELQGFRPQPSGETREAVLRGALARIVERYPAMSRQLLPGEKEALSAPPPVASGGQHSSGEAPITEDELAELPIDLAPRDGTFLRLRVRYDPDSDKSWTPLNDAEHSWTIGFNNLENTGEDRWQVVGWDWSQDFLLEAVDAEVIGWLPFHGELSTPARAEALSELAALDGETMDLPPVAETAGESVDEGVARGRIEKIIKANVRSYGRGGALTFTGVENAAKVILATYPRPPVPAADADRVLRDLADRVTAEVKRGADGSPLQALGALSNIEGLVLAAVKIGGEVDG